MNTNKLVLGISGNPDLKEKLSKLAPNDKATFEVEASLDEVAGDQAVFSVESASIMEEPPETEEEAGAMGESMTAEESGASEGGAMPAVMAAMMKKS
jgi:hypothetical protein